MWALGLKGLNNHQRNVVSGWAVAPGRDLVQHGLLHVDERLPSRALDDSLEPLDSQHLPTVIEDLGEPVRVEDQAVARVDVHLLSGRRTLEASIYLFTLQIGWLNSLYKCQEYVGSPRSRGALAT